MLKVQIRVTRVWLRRKKVAVFETMVYGDWNL
jgi:hypothetical protein